MSRGGRKSDVRESGRFWDAQAGRDGESLWMSHGAVRSYINESVTGDPGRWPLDWFKDRFARRPFARALSVGCGRGALERDLVAKDICCAIDAFDGSIGSLRAAARAAGRDRVSGKVRYFAADFNSVALPRAKYDAVFFHHSLHHVAKLEKLLRQVLLALKPGGLVFLDEYVGPSRHEWNERELAFQDEVYRSLVPAAARRFDRLPAPVVVDDPSEGIRSSEIEAQLRIGFDLLLERGYGGNLLWMLCPQIEWDKVEPGLISRLIDAEKRYLSRGKPSHFAVMIAMPKRGIRRGLASLRYFVEPKIKRLLVLVSRRRALSSRHDITSNSRSR